MMTDDKKEKKTIDSVASYHLLGRSGLRVSPLCLGTMTFGTEWGWGSEESGAREIFDRYIEAGGNFLDTADMYTGGTSEKWIGKFMKDAGNRDRLVIATKYTFSGHPSDPNAGGNSRKHMMESVEGSLQRLQTDYIDLYWMHAWDTMTPAEEVMAAFDALVQSGKVRYIGLSDTPAWYLARCQTLAEWRGWERVCALQLEYSLIERNIEYEHVPAALELGMGICPWSPLGGGILSGKYKRPEDGDQTEGRLKEVAESGNPVFNKFTDRNFDIVDVLKEVADTLGQSPAEVALNWVTKRPGVASTLIGATKPAQLESNLNALEFTIPDELSQKLDECSTPPDRFPYIFWGPNMIGMQHGEHPVRKEPAWYRG
jgi:aryl-alcohol dehydrogenase-like predicted oxidoreductase